MLKHRAMLSMFLLVVISCSSDGITSSGGSVAVKSWTIGGGCVSASPLPGWRDCAGTVTLNIPKTIPSGVVSVYFNYPDDGAFFHGQLQVGSGVPGTVTVNLVNDYISSCVTSFATTIDVYDGPETSQTASLLVSYPLTLNVTCT
jgi:hypothetical protein